jgi:hypothetical protein
MFIEVSVMISELVGAQQRHEHVDRHADRAGGVENRDDHGQIRFKNAA